jgi:hypothetical protein
MNVWPILALLIDSDDIDMVLGPLIVLGLLTAGIWYLVRRLRLRFAPSRWTMAEGMIQSVFCSNPANPAVASVFVGALAGTATRNSWNPVLQYSYQVAGEFYSGYLMLGNTFFSEEDAKAAAQPWLNKKITVRYNPRKLHESAFLVADGAPQGSRSLGDQPPASPGVITLSLK